MSIRFTKYVECNRCSMEADVYHSGRGKTTEGDPLEGWTYHYVVEWPNFNLDEEAYLPEETVAEEVMHFCPLCTQEVRRVLLAPRQKDDDA